jgi:truncated hemoglobin YjbI
MFLTFALGGGPDAYSGRPLAEAHRTLNITGEAFDTVGYHLRLSLEELDVERPLISIIMGFVEGTRGQVVTA